MRINPERARRHMRRDREAGAANEHARWIASMEPEHRAIHENMGNLGICGVCLSNGLRVMAEAMRR